jgi:hypothetical protein
MRWAVIDRNEEKWFVRTARVVAWLLAIPYAVLWAGRIAYGLQEAPRIYAWLTQHGLQFLDGAGFWILLALVPDFGIGLPAFMLFGFVRCQTQKNLPNQNTREGQAADCDFGASRLGLGWVGQADSVRACRSRIGRHSEN